MKKLTVILSLVLSLMMIATMAVAASAEDVIEVGTADALKTALTTAGASVKLTADIETTERIDITAATVDGNGHTISLADTSTANRMFNVTATSATFTLKNVTLDKKVSNGNGVIQFNNANATILLENVTVKDTGATACGNGMVIFTGASDVITMKNCTVIANAGGSSNSACVYVAGTGAKLELDGTTLDAVTNGGWRGITGANDVTSITVSNGSVVKGKDRGIQFGKGTALLVKKGTTVSSASANAIGINGSATGASVTVEGTLTAGYTGIYNDSSDANTVITLTADADVKATGGEGIYMKTGTINTAGKIEGKTNGITFINGTLNVTGGTISASGAETSNGISVSAGTVNVSGGTIQGDIGIKQAGGTVTIGNATVKSTTNSAYQMAAEAKITLTLNAGAKIVSDKVGITVGNNSEVTVNTGAEITAAGNGIEIANDVVNATVNVAGGTVTSTGAAGIAEALSTGSAHVINVSGGKIDGKTFGISAADTLNISGGEIHGASRAVTVTGATTAKVTIANAKILGDSLGLVVGKNNDIVINAGAQILSNANNAIHIGGTGVNVKVTVNEGAIVTSTSGRGIFEECKTAGINDQVVIINGGTITGANTAVEANGTLKINGGTFVAATTTSPVVLVAEKAVSVFELKNTPTFRGGSNPMTIGTTVTPYTNQQFSNAPELEAGAELKVGTTRDESGIRVTSTISKAVIDDLKSLMADEKFKSYTYGTLFALKADLEGIDFTIEALTAAGKKFVDIPATEKGIVENADGSVTFRAALVKIKASHNATDFAAISYIKYIANDDSVVYTYAEYTEGDNSFAVEDLAVPVYADVNAEKTEQYPNKTASYFKPVNGVYQEATTPVMYSRYSEKQRTIIKGFITSTAEMNAVKAGISTKITAHLDDYFKPIGRTAVSADGTLVADFSATGISFNAYCEGKVSVKFSVSAQTYFTVYVDGERQTTRVSVTPTDSWVVVATVEKGSHNIEIVKQSQYTMSLCELSAVLLEKGYYEAKPENKELFIQFYGDSITNGSNVLGGGTSVNTSDATKAFAWVTAQKLDADCEIIGCGGQDLIDTGAKNTMAQIFNKAGDVSRGLDWNTERKPDVIVIELGVNSLANGKNYTDDSYKAAVRSFVTKLQQAYPDAEIVWLDGYHTDAKTNIAVIKSALTGFDHITYGTASALTDLQDSWHPGENGAKLFANDVAKIINNLLD